MKWTILGLFSLGLVAAVCAALLVTSLRVGSGRRASGLQAASSPEATEGVLLVAARPLEALTVVDASALGSKSVPIAEMPLGAVTSEANAIGKVLLRPVAQGEVITTDLFAGLGSGVHVASALRPGMRAVTVTLTDNMGMEHLLYPGSVVDVLASMAVHDDPGGEARPVSMTLLQGIFVLAVGDDTVVSESAQATDVGSPMRQARRPSVTVLVDSKQAELLKLAMQEGSVSMVLRNPADEQAVVGAGTPLHELSPILDAPRERRQVVVLKGGQAETKTLTARGAQP
jgi:pilus assembly protein CpaB